MQPNKIRKLKFIYTPGESSIRIKELSVLLPLRLGEDREQILIHQLNLVLESHQSVLITGKKRDNSLRLVNMS